MSRLPRIVYQQGDHVCTLYSTPEEQLSAAVDYISGGLARGERCLYVCCDQTPAEFRDALKKAGVDVAAAEARGALVLLTKENGHLKDGCFEPAKMIAMLHAAVEDALAAGFTGLCAAGDMTWLLDAAPGSEQLVEYEALLNHFYSTKKALGLCQYSRTRLPAAVLDHCLATHPVVRVEGPILLTNPFYELPEHAMSRVASPDSVAQKLAEIDARTR